MSNKTLKRLSLKQGKKIVAKADSRYKNEVLGGKPSAKKVRKDNINTNPITFILWCAVIFILGVLVYAWLKVQPAAELYANTFQPDNAVFTYATGVVFGLIATIGFIFFKIMTDDPVVLQRQADNPLIAPNWSKGRIGNFWKIEVWSPRMFGVLTYLVLVWQIAIAITGIHNYSNVIEWLNALLPVLIEIGLATTVAKVLEQVRKRNYQVKEALNLQRQAFKDSFNNRNDDSRYLTILFQELREKLSGMRGNEWLRTANSEVTKEVISSEYNRLNAGNEFALNVITERSAQAETMAIVESATSPTDDQFTPPNGASKWTPDTLLQHFTARQDLNPNMAYKQTDLDEQYATGYNVRGAYRGDKGKRNGAKLYFKGNE